MCLKKLSEPCLFWSPVNRQAVLLDGIGFKVQVLVIIRYLHNDLLNSLISL